MDGSVPTKMRVAEYWKPHSPLDSYLTVGRVKPGSGPELGAINIICLIQDRGRSNCTGQSKRRSRFQQWDPVGRTMDVEHWLDRCALSRKLLCARNAAKVQIPASIFHFANELTVI